MRLKSDSRKVCSSYSLIKNPADDINSNIQICNSGNIESWHQTKYYFIYLSAINSKDSKLFHLQLICFFGPGCLSCTDKYKIMYGFLHKQRS